MLWPKSSRKGVRMFTKGARMEVRFGSIFVTPSLWPCPLPMQLKHFRLLWLRFNWSINHVNFFCWACWFVIDFNIEIWLLILSSLSPSSYWRFLQNTDNDIREIYIIFVRRGLDSLTFILCLISPGINHHIPGVANFNPFQSIAWTAILRRYRVYLPRNYLPLAWAEEEGVCSSIRCKESFWYCVACRPIPQNTGSRNLRESSQLH